MADPLFQSPPTGAELRALPNQPFARPLIPSWGASLILAAVIAALWPLAAVVNENLNGYYFDILIKIGVAIIMATSLNLINGITGQFSLGHAGFMAVGGYCAAVIFSHYYSTNWSEPMEAGAFLSVLIIGGIVAAIIGLGVGIPTLRLAGDYLAVATLGFGEIIKLVIQNTDSIRIPFTAPPVDPDPDKPAWNIFKVGGASGLHSIPQPQFTHYIFWTYAWVLICVVIIWRVVYSPRGRAFIAVREDEIAARAVGIDTTRQKVVAFILGAFFAGVAGGIQAMWTQNLDTKSFGFMRSFDFIVIVVLGGSGSITGVILAAIVLTYLPEQLRELKQWRMVIYSLLLILMMLFRPEGLLGRRELWWTRRRLAGGAAKEGGS